jgi:hypothetical protein
VGIFESKKKMVAYAYHFIFSSAWRTDNSYTGICTGSVYLCNILKMQRRLKSALRTLYEKEI